jgi:predicted nucleotidyltransferase
MEAVIGKIIGTLKTFKEVEAIAFGGSYARGVQDERSDVDVYVFYRGKFTSEKTRRRLLPPLANFERTFIIDTIDFFFYRGKIIHTWWVDMDKLKKDIRKDDVDSKVLVSDSKLLWDRNGKFARLRKSAKFPPRLAKEICVGGRTLSSVPIIFREIVEKSMHRNRIYFAESFIKTQTENIIKAIYALNRRYYNNYPQYLEHEFGKFRYVPRNAFSNINKIGKYSLLENPLEKLTALYELYWGTVELIEKRWKFPHAELFPEYADKKWYRKRIREISEDILKRK